MSNIPDRPPHITAIALARRQTLAFLGYPNKDIFEDNQTKLF
jgi:hypothetical protein